MKGIFYGALQVASPAHRGMCAGGHFFPNPITGKRQWVRLALDPEDKPRGLVETTINGRDENRYLIDPETGKPARTNDGSLQLNPLFGQACSKPMKLISQPNELVGIRAKPGILLVTEAEWKANYARESVVSEEPMRADINQRVAVAT